MAPSQQAIVEHSRPRLCEVWPSAIPPSPYASIRILKGLHNSSPGLGCFWFSDHRIPRLPDHPILARFARHPPPVPQLGFQRSYPVPSQSHPRLAEVSWLSASGFPITRSPDSPITGSPDLKGGTPLRVIPDWRGFQRFASVWRGAQRGFPSRSFVTFVVRAFGCWFFRLIAICYLLAARFSKIDTASQP